ncbi:MAG: GTA-gp10 family protein [Pseudomonadota bacterium]|jgi:hypothetical protein
MSECARDITWAGGKHVFDLGDPRVRLMMQVRGLPGQYGNTPAACFRRFEEGVYSTEDVERVIELGLIGGGLLRGEAEQLLDAHVRAKALAPNAMLAMNVLTALFVGAENADASA